MSNQHKSELAEFGPDSGPGTGNGNGPGSESRSGFGLSNEYILILEFEMKRGVELIENILHFLRLRLRLAKVCHDIFIIHCRQNIRL